MTDDYTATVTFTHRRADVLDALTTTEGITGWWSEVTGDAQQGGELRFTFGGDAPGLLVHVDEASAHRVQWTAVSCPILADWDGTVLHFDVVDRPGGGCTLTFRHAGLTPDVECFEFCAPSWDHFLLASLRDFVETGVGHPRGSAADLAWRAARDAAKATVG